MASKDPIPLYFFNLTPSAKKYSPGASDVPANIEPIITEMTQYKSWETSSHIKFEHTTKKLQFT